MLGCGAAIVGDGAAVVEDGALAIGDGAEMRGNGSQLHRDGSSPPGGGAEVLAVGGRIRRETARLKSAHPLIGHAEAERGARGVWLSVAGAQSQLTAQQNQEDKGKRGAIRLKTPRTS